VVVVSATGGVEVGTEKVWDYCEKREDPAPFFVSLRTRSTPTSRKVTPRSKSASPPSDPGGDPRGAKAPSSTGSSPLLEASATLYKKGTKAGEYEEGDVPPEYRDRFERYSKS